MANKAIIVLATVIPTDTIVVVAVNHVAPTVDFPSSAVWASAPADCTLRYGARANTANSSSWLNSFSLAWLLLRFTFDSAGDDDDDGDDGDAFTTIITTANRMSVQRAAVKWTVSWSAPASQAVGLSSQPVKILILAPDKDPTSRLDATIFEDLDRYCWQQQAVATAATSPVATTANQHQQHRSTPANSIQHSSHLHSQHRQIKRIHTSNNNTCIIISHICTRNNNSQLPCIIHNDKWR
ncbi:unnamed protein product [Ceratitis capitata]|uniref:(Mediterranean fruit fly) hypothetical protein n=1 Tax=Ceratitis capitata TaxID=7213 RepID=A0A811TXT9_CERCA|nr:unnamed protein product [Ceratitis capitata]